MKLIEDGELAATVPGKTRRKLRLAEVLDYRDRLHARRTEFIANSSAEFHDAGEDPEKQLGGRRRCCNLSGALGSEVLNLVVRYLAQVTTTRLGPLVLSGQLVAQRGLARGEWTSVIGLDLGPQWDPLPYKNRHRPMPTVRLSHGFRELALLRPRCGCGPAPGRRARCPPPLSRLRMLRPFRSGRARALARRLKELEAQDQLEDLFDGALWDVFHTLWQPSGQGRISRAVMRTVWRLSHRAGPAVAGRSGPAAMVLVIATWAGLVVLGSALVYWPHLPDGFSYSPGLMPEQRHDLLDAVYVSLLTVTTLGLGDIVPTVPALRVAVPVEALLGFGLLTAAVSWVLQVYPALIRRRALAFKLETFRRTGTADVLQDMHPAVASRLVGDLSDAVGQTCVDLLQYSDTYYFRDANPQTTLAVALPYARELGHIAGKGTSPDVRHAGTVLLTAVDDLAELVDQQYLRTGADTDTVLHAYQRDQRMPPRAR